MTREQRILRIARKVRRWAENVADTECFDSDLTGLCARSSAEVHRFLRRAGIRSRMVLGNGHCFVVTGGYVVDVTATQFGFRNHVVYRPWSEMKEEGNEWRDYGISYTFIRKLHKRQKREGWPADQIVRPT